MPSPSDPSPVPPTSEASTPGPITVGEWHEPFEIVQSLPIRDKDGGTVAYCPDNIDTEANAKRLALCWNSHDALLAAAERAYTLCPPGHSEDKAGIWFELRSAIAAARGGVA